MLAEFHHLEESLKEFFIESQKDSYNAKNINYYKYHNLRVFMDVKRSKEPHFIVRVGISESMHNLISGEKMAGGLGSDERYVYRWIEKVSVRAELDEAWKITQKFETVQMKNSDD